MARNVLIHAGGSFDAGAQGDIMAAWPLAAPITILSGATDAINPYNQNGNNYVVTYAGVDAMTLAAPVAGTDDGLCIAVYSGGAHAHTITSTGHFSTGASGTGLLTFAAYAGAGLVLRAYNGYWQVIINNAVTISS